MAGTLTPTGENRSLAWLFTTTSPSRPTQWFLGLHVGASSNGTANEIVGNGYARQAVSWTLSGNQISNTSAISFGPATGGGWGTVTDFCVYDAVTSGTPLAAGTVTASVAYSIGDSATMASGSVVLTLT